MGILRNIVDDNKLTPEDLPKFEAKLFYEGAKRRVNLERFAMLLVLSTIIATFGVLGDSTATVIGAMIIAPLMTPIMATAAGLVMGDMKRAGQAFLTVVLGVAGVIALAWLIHQPGLTAPVIWATKMNNLEEAVAAVDIKLSAEECAYLEELYQPHPILGHS